MELQQDCLRAHTRKVFLFVAGLMLALGSNLQAQAILGTWQGTLPIPVSPRIIVKVAKADDGSLRSVFYRIDMDDSSIPFATVTFASPDVSLVADLIDINFHGKLSADGKSIAGTWTQDKKSYPLTFTLTAPDAVWKHEGIAPLPAMAANADPTFEVATIKPSVPGATAGQRYFALRTRHFAAKNSTVADIMKFAYKIRDRQISGAPAWFDEARFDIAAEPDAEGQPSEDQYRLMLRKLLTERFHLTKHSVEQVFPVYALTVQKDAPKLMRSDPGFNNHGRIFVKEAPDDQTLVEFTYMTMPEFENILMNFIPERQIVDETGLAGTYDFTLTVPSSVLQGGPDDNEKATAFFSAVQPLGFRIVPKKEPLEVFVIDRLEKPSAN